MANSDINFNNFYEFVELCRTVDTNNWSEKEVREFNKRVYSLMKEDIIFKEKYTKLSAKLKRQDIRSNISKQRTKISLSNKKENYRKGSVVYKISRTNIVAR